MALHRDIFWVGRQWAVTGFGLQACDQKQKSKFDIEASQLWDDGVVESVRALKWLNAEDFANALSIARQRYPEVAGRNRAPPSPREAVLPVRNGSVAAPIPTASKPDRPNGQKVVSAVPKTPAAIKPVAVEQPKLAEPWFAMRFAGRAKFIGSWRIQIKH